MNSVDLQPITNETALIIKSKKILVIADLHIGIESELRGRGLNTTSQTPKMIDRILSLCEKYKPKEIIFLGDVKHNIPSSTISERRDVKNFLEKIKEYARLHIIPGNHDGNIKKLIPEDVILHPSEGIVFEGIGFFHGHRWPAKDIMQSEKLIMAHTHPTIMLTDRLNHRNFEPCWIKTSFIKDKFLEKYSKTSNSKILIIPAFNPLCGGIALNKDGITGPLGKIIDIQNAEVYLLDGTSLGKIKSIK
jgi:hypothetical protein